MTKRRAESGGEMPMVFWVPTEHQHDGEQTRAKPVKGCQGTHSLRDGCTGCGHSLGVSNDALVEQAP